MFSGHSEQVDNKIQSRMALGQMLRQTFRILRQPPARILAYCIKFRMNFGKIPKN